VVDTVTRPRPADTGSWAPRRAADAAWRRVEAALPDGPVSLVGVLAVVLAVGGVAEWWVSVVDLPLPAMTDVGLVSVLPPGVWAGFLLVGMSFAVALQSGRTTPIVVSLVATVLVLHGLGVVGEPEMRFDVAWRHIGIADYFRTRGAADPTLDAYQSWPAFFALTAAVWQATGIGDPSVALAWAPVAFNLLYLAPLVAIGHRVFQDRAVVWLAAWLFTVSNWIGQDYFSPQGWYLLVYLTIIAVILEWFTVPVAAGTSPEGVTGPGLRPKGWRRLRVSAAPALSSRGGTPQQRTAMLAILFLLVLVTIAGHQLTPYALVFTTSAAALIGWSRLRTLPVVLLLGALGWTGYAAAAYSAGHSDNFTQVGALSSIFQQTVQGRLTGSPGHELIVQLRLLEAPVLWGLAALGAFRLFRSGRSAAARGLAVLALSTFPVLALQSYGGEALMRIAFFALPFSALLAAVGLVGPSPSTARLRAAVPVVVVCVLLVVLFPFTRYGNERVDSYMPEEVSGVREMYRLAPPGSVITSVDGSLPWKATRYADDEYRLLVDGDTVETSPVVEEAGTAIDLDTPDRALLTAQVISRMSPRPGQRSVLIASRTQGANLDLVGPFEPGAENRLLAVLRSSPAFTTIYANEYVTVFELTGGTPR
jgi:hypothetical protein